MLEHKCDKCRTELGYKGLCYKCKAEEERNKTLALTDDEIKEIINKYVKKLKEKDIDKELLNGIYIYDLIAYRNIDLKDIAKKALEKKTGKKLSDKQYEKILMMAQDIFQTQKENFRKEVDKDGNG